MAGERILIVDDEPTVLDACARALLRRNYQVQTAPGGLDAIRRLDSEDFDLLLTDIKMPDVDGLEVIGHARDANPDLACVVLTGHGSADTAIDSIRLGVSGFVVKPFTLDELMRAVDLPLEKARLRRENIRLKTLVPLFDVGSTLEREYEFDALYDAMLSAGREGLRAEACQLVLAPGFGPTLHSPVAVGSYEDAGRHDPLTSVTTVASSWWEPVARYFGSCVEPLIVERRISSEEAVPGVAPASASDLSRAAIAALQQAGLEDAVVVGLIANGRVLGALLISKPSQPAAGQGALSAQMNVGDREWMRILGTMSGAALMLAKLTAERAISDERLDTMFSSAPYGMLTLDTAGRVVRVNRVGASILGRSPAHLPGADISEIFKGVAAGQSAPELSRQLFMRKVRAGERVAGILVETSSPDGQTRSLQVNAAPVLRADGTIDEAIISFIDVTVSA